MKIKRLLAGLMTAAVLATGLSYNVPAKAANETNATTEEDVLVNQDGRKANSWRYSDGKPKENVGTLSGTFAMVNDLSGQLVSETKQVGVGALVRGIDVSSHNGHPAIAGRCSSINPIDWNKVKQSGLVDYVIIRCGYGDNLVSQDDYAWEYNASECERLGIPYGVYLYSYATNTAMAKSEAEHTLRLLAGHHPSLPIYLDMEDESTLDAGKAGLASIAQVYCNTLSAAGYDVGIYASLSWFENYLNTSTFDNPEWSKWVAQYWTMCQYKKPYDMWQYSSNGDIPGIIRTNPKSCVDMNYWVSDNTAVPVSNKNLISYQTYLDGGSNWEKAVANGVQSNSVCLAKGMQLLKINSGSIDLSYRAHIQDVGWTSWVSKGGTLGTKGKNIEAVQIKLNGSAAQNYDVYYRVKNIGFGWTGWGKNGESVGCIRYGRRAQAIQIAVIKNSGESVPKSSKKVYREAGLVYQGHVQNIGTMSAVYEGETCGSVGTGKRLEAFKISKSSEIKLNGDVEYQVYANNAWQPMCKNGQLAGAEGKNLQIQAVKINLKGDLSKEYNVYYRVYSSYFDDWQGWTYNGNRAGTIGLGSYIEGIQIELVKKNQGAPGSTDRAFVYPYVLYQTHIQNIGWESTPKFDGELSGTSGKSYRLEGIKINKGPRLVGSGNIEYRTHIQNIGWEKEYKKNGQMSGTSGRSLRLEAIQIRLTGDLANKYDIYYRVHTQDYGWLDWAKNDEVAGTSGLSKRLEAIQIVIVDKGASAPGSTTRACVSPKVAYTTHVQNVGWQDMKHDGEIAGTTGRSLRLEGIKIVNNTGIPGSINYQVHVQNIGWQSARYNGQLAGTTGRSLRLEAIRISLTGELASKYDVYYRVHCQNIGWMGWAKNGDPAGSAGFSYRLEGIQIVYVPKGGAAPGSTARAFIQR